MSNQELDNRVHASVEGRVQGVGFRYFVARSADSLGVQGWVRNRPNGTVELIAEAPVETLQSFIRKVRKGPPGSFVSEMKTDWHPATGEFKRFRIRQTG